MSLFYLTGAGIINYFFVVSCDCVFSLFPFWICLAASLFFFCAGVSIRVLVQEDPATGLLTTSSTLEYSAMKEDTDAQFSCSTQHTVAAEMVSPPVTFTITCESAKSG